MSERRACRLVGQDRSTQRYSPMPAEFEQRVVKRMNELAVEYPRWGYRKVWALLRAEGFAVNRKRIERLWRLEGREHADLQGWSEWADLDSNQDLTDYESAALTIELPARGRRTVS